MRQPKQPRLRLTDGEALCLLGCAVQGIAHYGNPDQLDDEDRQSLLELRSAAMKLAQLVGMTMTELHQFAAHAAGCPPEGIVKVIDQELRARGERR